MIVFYIEDRDTDAKLFGILLKTAAATRCIRIEISNFKTVEELPSAPCCDIILLDAQLNGSAEKTMDWVRQKHLHLPAIFMLSGHPSHSADCIRAGAEDFMDKGEAIHDAIRLIDRMQLAVERHRARQI